MSKKASLFLLIKSLTKSEKRYLKLSTFGAGTSKNYMLLFDCIDKLEVYDEKAVRKQFEGYDFVRQLHVMKIYLYDMIMKALRSYHADSSIDSRLLNMIADIEILYDRELYDACKYKIDKAEALATKYERLPLLMEILSRKRQLQSVRNTTPEQPKTDICDLEQRVLADMTHLNAYWRKVSDVFSVVQEPGFLNTLGENEPTTAKAYSLHQHLLYSYCFINGKQQEGVREISKLIDYLAARPHLVEEDPSGYVTAVSNKIGFLFAQKRYDEIPAEIALMRSVPETYKLKKGSRFTVRLWLRLFNLELELYRDTTNLAAAKQLSKEIELFIGQHKGAIPDDYRIMLYYQMMNICFAAADYSGALDWSNELINRNFKDTRIDLQCWARILNMMIHFELGNIIVLRYALGSTRRFFKKKKTVSATEKKVLQLLSRLSTAAPFETAELFRLAYEDMYAGAASGTETVIDEYVPFKDWLAGKRNLR